MKLRNRCGVIDIGTLKVKCQIVDKELTGRLLTIYQSNNLTCLGCHMDQNNNRPKDENLQKTLKELKRCKRMLVRYGVTKMRAVSTHALREMGEVGRKIAELIKSKIGLDVEIISQEEEAELFFKAVLTDFESFRNYIIADVGGGSVQILVGSRDKLKQAFLLKTGTSTLWDKFTPTHAEMDFPKRGDIRRMKNYILSELQPVPKGIKAPIIYGSSCIIDLFRGIRLPMQKYHTSKSHPFRVKVSDMEKFLAEV